jgi:hypothetical protein
LVIDNKWRCECGSDSQTYDRYNRASLLQARERISLLKKAFFKQLALQVTNNKVAFELPGWIKVKSTSN